MIHRTVLVARNCNLEHRSVSVGGSGSRLGLALALVSLSGCEAIRDIRVVTPNVRYIAFGDSSTAGPAERDYPDFLRALLGVEADTFANEGRSGETTEEGVDRLKGLFTDKIYPNAEVLLYWEGGNDVSEFIKEHDPFLLASPDEPDFPLANDLALIYSQIQVNIESAIVAARAAGLRVYVGTYFFLREDLAECKALPIPVVSASQAHNANVYITRLNERIRAAVTNQQAILVDVATIDDQLRQDPANYFDCDHLSEQGNAIVAELFHQAIVGTTN